MKTEETQKSPVTQVSIVQRKLSPGSFEILTPLAAWTRGKSRSVCVMVVMEWIYLLRNGLSGLHVARDIIVIIIPP